MKLYMKNFIIIIFLIGQTSVAFAQQTTGISGKVIDSKTQQPLSYVVVSIQNTSLMQLTTAEGKFRFENVPARRPIGIITQSRV